MPSSLVIIRCHGDIGDQIPVDAWDYLIYELSATFSKYRSLGFSEFKVARELNFQLNREFPEWRNDRKQVSTKLSLHIDKTNQIIF